MSNKVYFVHDKDHYEGVYVGAPTRGKAKEIGWHEIGCDFFDVRTEVIGNVTTEMNGVLPKSELYALDIYSPEEA